MILVGMQVRSSRSWMAGASWSPTVPARRKHANRGLGGCTWYWPDQDRRAGAQRTCREVLYNALLRIEYEPSS